MQVASLMQLGAWRKAFGRRLGKFLTFFLLSHLKPAADRKNVKTDALVGIGQSDGWRGSTPR